MVKITGTACALLAVGSASAYSTPSRATLRSMGTKTIPTTSSRRVGASMKMEGMFFITIFCLSLLLYCIMLIGLLLIIDYPLNFVFLH